ncbi:MAG: hypothetical protein C0506_07140 [Anaerolinea sp.]|nr:hypothetical protein [Anaerolinea sp.]
MSHLEDDPQLTAILSRVKSLAGAMEQQRASILAARSELDELQEALRGSEGDRVKWILRPHSRGDEQRAA